MRKTNLLVAALLMAQLASAQTLVGLKAGTSFIAAKDKLGGKYGAHVPAMVAGLVIEHDFGKGLVIGGELLYEQRKFASGMVYTDKIGNPIAAQKDGYYAYNAISAPIFFGFKSTLKTVYITFTWGAIPAYIPSPYLRYATTDNPDLQQYSGKKFDFGKSYFDVSAMANFGAGVKFGRYELGLQARGQYSLTTLDLPALRTYGIVGTINFMYRL